MAAAAVKDAPRQELGSDLIAAIPSWELLGGHLRGSTVDREYVSELRWPNSVPVFSKMRNDTQLSGLYRGTSLPIRRYVWGIDPNGANPKTVERICRHYNLQTIDKAWQAFLTGQSDPTPRARNKFVFDKHSQDAQRAIYYGHYYFELHGAIGDDGFWQPEDASPRSPWTISQIFAAQNGDLVAIKQNVGLVGPELDAQRLVAYVFDQEPGDWTGRSMFRSCYREWLLKDRLLRVDAINHEKAGGILLNEAPKDATPAQIAALAELAQNARVGGGGAMPNGTTPVFIRGTGSDVIGSINRHDEAMAREFLMMFMALGTSSSGGNRALAGSFIDWFAISQEAIALWQRDTFQRDVIDRDVAWNDGDQDYVPQLVFKRPEEANPLDSLAKQVTTADQAGDPGAIGIQSADGTVVPVAAIRYGRGGRMTLVPQIVVDEDAHEEIHTAHADYEQWARPQRKAKPAARAVDPATLQPETSFRRNLYPHEVRAATDFNALDSTWRNTVDQLVADWKQIKNGQIAELVAAIEAAGGDLATLAQIQASVDGADIVAARLTAMAHTSAQAATGEAVAQGVVAATVPGLSSLEDELAARATAIEQLLASSLSQAAAGKAVQLTGGSLTSTEVATQVGDYLAGLSDTYLADQFGGALSAAQNAGRMAAMVSNGATDFYASELLDQNTCGPCSDEDGTHFATSEEAAAAYPTGGFRDCEGGTRCRGAIVAVYNESAPSVSAALERRLDALTAAVERPVEVHLHDERTIEVPVHVDVHAHHAAEAPLQLSLEEGAIHNEIHVDVPAPRRPRNAVARRGADGELQVEWTNEGDDQ